MKTTHTLKILVIVTSLLAYQIPSVSSRRRKRPKRPHVCDSASPPKICDILKKLCPSRKSCKRIRLDGEMNDGLQKLKLKRLPDRVFWGYKSLEELLITDTDLERLPTHLPRNLKNLQLFNNKINYIPPGVFDELRDLEKVYLKNGFKMFKPKLKFFRELKMSHFLFYPETS